MCCGSKKTENFIYQPFGLRSYNDTDMLCDSYVVKNKHRKQPHDNINMAAVIFGTFCTVFIMLLVWMDRQLDFQKKRNHKVPRDCPLLLPLVTF